MIKKITTIISANHKSIARKVIVIGVVTLGIGIGLLNKAEDPDLVIVEEFLPDDEADAIEGDIVEQ